ncbi:HAD-IA family hydrolase [Gemmatimonadota bacterium]
MPQSFDAILFDLLTGLLDSWSFWDRLARNPDSGRRWRLRYLDLSYRVGPYRSFESLVAEAAANVGLPESLADVVVAEWDRLDPWPEAPEVLASLGGYRIGVVTNCSEALAQRAAQRVGAPFSVVVSAERAGAYKPSPLPYRLALSELNLQPERVLYVAGSPYDIIGASNLGMTVFWYNRPGLVSDSSSRAAKTAKNLYLLEHWLRSGTGR